MSEQTPLPDSRAAAASDQSAHYRRYAYIVLIVALVLAAWGIFSRIYARSELRQQTQAAAIPTVNVTQPATTGDGEQLILPGTVEAFSEAPIYARTSGYLKRWLVDIGGRVKAGQLLAEIETPEVDQELRQAEADLASAKANEQLARVTAERWQGLLANDSVSRQDADQKASDAAAKKAAVDSAQANVGRLRELESFKRVVAPFDGVVTARNTDVGALIAVGGSGGTELFRVADTRKLRVYVQVPQAYAASITQDLPADVRFSDRPNSSVPAKVVSTAGAIDPSARTMLTQLEVDNPEAALLSGGYSEVHFKLPVGAGALRVPSNTLVFRSVGMQAAVVGDDSHVSMKTLTIGRDFGTEVEILAGLQPQDRVILNPSDSIADGQAVTVATKGK